MMNTLERRRFLVFIVIMTTFPALLGCKERVFSLDPKEGYMAFCAGGAGDTYYVRMDGGDSDQCNGLADAPYSGSDTSQNCAFNHPFQALPPGGDPVLAPGDRLIIDDGVYEMGVGAPGAMSSTNCGTAFPQFCHMPSIPSGEDESLPTCILGKGWDDECLEPPVLTAVGGATTIINLSQSENVHVKCLELTDDSSCILNADHPFSCEDGAEEPNGITGVMAEDAHRIHLDDLYIHGMSAYGILGEWVGEWNINNTETISNGKAGISLSSEIDEDEEFAHNLVMSNVESSWNGCTGMPQIGEEFSGCTDTKGVGLELFFSNGSAFIEGSTFSFNTWHGISTYQEEIPELTIQRSLVGFNASHQMVTKGGLFMENSLVISKCSAFEDMFFEGSVIPCESGGHGIHFLGGEDLYGVIVNNTFWGEGTSILHLEPDEEDCDVEDLIFRNNIFAGSEVYGAPTQRPLLFDFNTCPEFEVDMGYSVYHMLDEELPEHFHNAIAGDPLFVQSPTSDSFDLMISPGSPALDQGISDEQFDQLPHEDFLRNPRPAGDGFDIGAYERQ